jgi:hypothetical protein
MNILYTIDADQIEDGDQILIDGDPLENVTVSDDPMDDFAVVIKGFSNDTGDVETYTVPFDYPVEVWAV